MRITSEGGKLLVERLTPWVNPREKREGMRNKIKQQFKDLKENFKKKKEEKEDSEAEKDLDQEEARPLLRDVQ